MIKLLLNVPEYELLQSILVWCLNDKFYLQEPTEKVEALIMKLQEAGDK